MRLGSWASFIAFFLGFFLLREFLVFLDMSKEETSTLHQSLMKTNPLCGKCKKFKPFMYPSCLRNLICEAYENLDNTAWNTTARFIQAIKKLDLDLPEQAEACKGSASAASQQEPQPEMEHSGSFMGSEISFLLTGNDSQRHFPHQPCVYSWTHTLPKATSQQPSNNQSCSQSVTNYVSQASARILLLMMSTIKKATKPFFTKARRPSSSKGKSPIPEKLKSKSAKDIGPGITNTAASSSGSNHSGDLTEYFQKRKAKVSVQSHRYVRDCQPHKYGNVTHQTQASHGLLSQDITLPITTVSHFIDEFNNEWGLPETNNGHYAVINNPARTVSVLEPLTEGGCENNYRASVVEMAKKHDCLVAVNAGFFNTHTGNCLGNVVSDGRFVENSHGIQNAHFGIKADGTLVFGYLSEEDVLDTTNPFIQLVGGVGWVIRDGENYVEESTKAECEDTEETGTIEHFFTVKSARTIIGSDSLGRVILVQVDGKTGSSGVSLNQLATWLLEHGVVNAINLDGGGSATYVVNGSLVNYASDKCPDQNFRCPRQVSTVVCVHKPLCTPPDCSGHGQCILGKCQCTGNWEGPGCSTLVCGTSNCSGNGRCTEGGCDCNAGFRPPDCSRQCLPLQYGPNCQNVCLCQNGGYCEPVTGECICMSGYTGEFCEQVCPYGTYGPECNKQCDCFLESCPCHHVTGSCSFQKNESFWTPVMSAGQCLANREIERQHLVPYVPLQENIFFISSLVLSALLFVSLVCNVLLFCFKCSCHCSRSSPLLRSSNHSYQRLSLLDDSDGL